MKFSNERASAKIVLVKLMTSFDAVVHGHVSFIHFTGMIFVRINVFTSVSMHAVILQVELVSLHL